MATPSFHRPLITINDSAAGDVTVVGSHFSSSCVVLSCHIYLHRSPVWGPLWGPLGHLWGLLGRSWEVLGASQGPLGDLLWGLGDLLGGLWGLLGDLRRTLGASWAIFGASLRFFVQSLASLGGSLGPGNHLGAKTYPKGFPEQAE